MNQQYGVKLLDLKLQESSHLESDFFGGSGGAGGCGGSGGCGGGGGCNGGSGGSGGCGGNNGLMREQPNK